MSAPKPLEKLNPTVRVIVASWLEVHGFDGLFNEDECACDLSELMPCGSNPDGCTAGYKAACTCGDGHQYHINKTKPEAITP